MKKFKGLFLCLTLLFTVAMLTACGKVPEPTEKDVLKALEKEDYLSEEVIDNDLCSVEMKEVEIDDDKEGATVKCIVSVDGDYVRTNTEYKIKFKIKDDKESWKVKKVTQDEVTYELIKGMDDEKLSDFLYWDTLNIDGSYIYYYNDSTTLSIVEHEINGEEMTDVVTVEVTGVSGYETITATVKYNLRYEYSYGSGYWYNQETEVVEYSTEYVDGYEIAFTEDRIVEDIIYKRNYVYALGSYYYLTDEEVTVSNVTIGDNDYSDSWLYVPVTINVAYKDFSFDVNYTLTYYFDSYDMEWEIYYLSIEGYSNYAGYFVGVWKGTSDDGQVVLTIGNAPHEYYDDAIDVVIEITTSTGVVYKYSAYLDVYYPESGAMVIYDYDWIDAPSGSSYYREDFDGYIEDGAFISDDYWYDFTLYKE